MLDPSPPREFPKMLYRGQDYQIAQTAQQESLLVSEGYSSRVSIPSPPAEPAERPQARVISIQLKPPAKDSPDGPDENTNAVDDEVQG